MLILAGGMSLAAGAQPPAGAQGNSSPSQPAQTASPKRDPAKPAYSLPPETLARAIAYSHIRVVLDFVSSGWSIVSLVLLLGLGGIARMRDVAVNLSRNRWVQGVVFALLLLLATTLLELPLDMYGHHVSVSYGQSVQGWGSWFADAGKGFLLTLAVGVPVVMLLFRVIRRSPSRWWFWFWIPAMLLVLVSVFVAPVLIDPLFNKFEPLSKSDPALVDRLEQVVARGGVQIPPGRMYLMKASEKVTGLNAYVTGYGASKRVVVWDNTTAKATPDEISFIFGHELGHYVLNHIPKTLAFLGVLLLVEFYLGYRGVRWLLERYGRDWHIPSQNDWGMLAVMLLVLSVLSFFTEPVVNGYSRMNEHEADIYGQEVIHGIVADPQTAAQQAFQVLGEVSLTDPNPNAFVTFWTFSHPSVAYRAAFAAAYDPWNADRHPKFFKK
ncbi:MAG: M48 family metallopeptidase [Edaphobacter sp.]|uniref:M48 family metallopeptidase n=1 Tax=Edaphobacter sp. TaxID=1934404 RepID=UPI0023A470EB|nr:M48 family metallopeptidase [Edaphobacter sp.]MDE1177072.1 M48 family metallopeptidase [Edaphobacter sp.]